jgi:hypothetical protein
MHLAFAYPAALLRPRSGGSAFQALNAQLAVSLEEAA